MAFLSLYRKYRPKNFSDLVGQEQVVQTLKNSIEFERISHAYLFAGPRGTGKTSTAKVYARALNCLEEERIEPCGQCENCKRIDNDQSMDLIEIDAASNRGIEAIRELREKVKFYPGEGRYKIYIIDEVHMLTNQAFNALLKTLEEPPDKVIFILATTEPHKVIPTILSRCQRFDFSLLTQQEIASRLEYICQEENIQYEREALNLIAYSSSGGMRDAISLLDQAISYSGKDISLEQIEEMLGRVKVKTLSRFVNYLAENDTAGAIELSGQLQSAGRTVGRIVSDLIDYCRQLMLIANDSPKLAYRGLDSGRKNLLENDSKLFSADEINYIVSKLTELDGQLRYAERPDILLELTLVRLTDPAADESRAGLARRLTEIEDKLAAIESGQGISFAPEEEVLVEAEKKSVETKSSGGSKSSVEPETKDKSVDKIAQNTQKDSVSEQRFEKSDKIDSIRQAESSDSRGKKVAQSSKNTESRPIPEKTWQKILNDIRNEDIRTHAMVKESQLPIRKGDKLKFIFSKDKQFHYQQAAKQSALIERVVNQLASENLTVQLEIEGEKNINDNREGGSGNFSKGESSSQNSSNRSSQGEFPLLKEAQKVFGGRIIKVSDEMISNFKGGNKNEHEENDETGTTDAG
ncbi:DNA polymerase III subunit gamma/tau [Halanaerobiaceae bacterium Z-7014]|uniref:DNA-directed DNA polymerase n=1 Tax=Halonatronomonas betaini TaxID=2778430 RepID=A0A931FBG7_9FIRM|nr:DNA polymerase III subunit gamma/tau [Halonatronomonas betaini]MBF8437967.1 DNA polymerase III subunit gamma/tau [Halonatronomonas betaini]